MALNITTSGSTTIATEAKAILIQVNKALTGTIAVAVAGNTEYGTAAATIATITNPTVGTFYRYGGLAQQGAVTVNPSTSTDITVTVVRNIT